MRTKITLYLEPKVEQALRHYAVRHQISMSDASNHLIERATFGALDEATESLLVPEIRRAAAAGARAALEDVITKALEKQSNRLAGLLVKSGRDSAANVELSRDILEELYGSKELADNRQRDARLKAGSGYTREGIRKEIESNGS